jgi:hypothetical protein
LGSNPWIDHVQADSRTRKNRLGRCRAVRGGLAEKNEVRSERVTFGEVCRAAGCPGSAHGLRKAGARRAAEDGETEAQLNALFGWADGCRESATYTRTANRAGPQGAEKYRTGSQDPPAQKR